MSKRTAEHNAKIAAARLGSRHSDETKAAIGSGVRQGERNKVPFNTRIDAELERKLRRVSYQRKTPMVALIEDWIRRLKEN